MASLVPTTFGQIQAPSSSGSDLLVSLIKNRPSQAGDLKDLVGEYTKAKASERANEVESLINTTLENGGSVSDALQQAKDLGYTANDLNNAKAIDVAKNVRSSIDQNLISQIRQAQEARAVEMHPLDVKSKELSHQSIAQQMQLAKNQEQRAQQDFSKKVKENAETIEANQAKRELAELISRTGDPDTALNQQQKKQSGSNNSILNKELPTLFKGQTLQTGTPKKKDATDLSATQKTSALYELNKRNIAETQGILQAISNITCRSVSDIIKDEKLKNIDAFASNLAKEAGYKDPADINDFKDTIFTAYNNLSAKYPTLDREVLLQMIATNVEPATLSQFPVIGNYLQPNVNIKNIASQLDPLFTITDEQGNKKKSSLPWYRARNTVIQGEKLLEEMNKIPEILSKLEVEQAVENSKNDRNFKNKIIDAQTYQQKKNAIERFYAAKAAPLQESLIRFEALRKTIDRDNLNN